MAVVLIPMMIYVSVNKLLPETIPFLWVIVTPIAWLGVLLIGALTLYLAKIDIFVYQPLVIALSGFVVNLVVFCLHFKIFKYS